MFNVTSAVACMAGSVVLRGAAKHTQVKTRHFYLARTRHLHIAATPTSLIIVIMSNRKRAANDDRRLALVCWRAAAGLKFRRNWNEIEIRTRAGTMLRNLLVEPDTHRSPTRSSSAMYENTRMRTIAITCCRGGISWRSTAWRTRC